MTRSSERFTLVSFHAHPDDEALLTGGLLARMAAEGHRVVLVTATAGERGLTSDEARQHLADVRMAELAASAELLGCARVVGLAYADSGLHPDPDDLAAFANQDPAQCAAVLAAVLREEQADVLTVYDAHGGYGHPDHVQVHRVGVLAASLAETPVVLEATVPGRLFAGVLRVLALLGHPLGGSAPLGTAEVFAHPRAITHRVRVRGDALRRKRAAMAVHGSQRRGGSEQRSIERFVRLPVPLFWLFFGREWFVERGRHAPDRLDDVFVSVRGSTVGRSR
jgi:LmbE family N-acetylglucosaminyl deacetylase